MENDSGGVLPGYYQALYVLMQSLVDPDTAWNKAMAIKDFNFTAFPLTKTSAPPHLLPACLAD